MNRHPLQRMWGIYFLIIKKYEETHRLRSKPFSVWEKTQIIWLGNIHLYTISTRNNYCAVEFEWFIRKYTIQQNLEWLSTVVDVALT